MSKTNNTSTPLRTGGGVNIDRSIDYLKTLQASYDSMADSYSHVASSVATLTALDSDIVAGKQALAEAISDKGVNTESANTLVQMASNVHAISQAPIIMNDGDISHMLYKQMYGTQSNDVVPGYWNLYEIMAQLLSDGRLVNYGGILLAEYYKGYASLALSGAGAGGAYVVSDKDSNGNFIMYTNDTTHTWNTEDDGKGNRWVAYCFVDAGHDFDITDTNTSPRSIHIGRSVGRIVSLTNGRVSSIIKSDNASLGSFNTGSFTQNFGKTAVLFLDNVESEDVVLRNPVATELIYFEGVLGGSLISANQSLSNLNTIIFRGTFNNGSIIKSHECFNSGLKQVIIDGSGRIKFCDWVTYIKASITMVATVNGSLKIYGGNANFNISKLIIKHNGNTQDLELQWDSKLYTSWGNTSDIDVQDGWNYNMDISVCVALTEENMYAHILQRLKQDEPDCGDGVTIILGQTNIDKLTSNDNPNRVRDITKLNTLIGTYGYAFTGYTPITLE